jgi:hypothetical protein
MRNRRRKWIIRRLVLGFAVAAIAAPVAQARLDLDTQSQASKAQESNGYIPWVTDFGRSASTQASPVRPDDRAVRGVQATDGQLAVRPDDRAVRGVQATDGQLAVRPDDRAVRGVHATDERLPVRADDKVLNLDPAVGAEYNQFTYRRALPTDYGIQPVQIASKGDGFDWSDAGIGAGLAFGLMLLAAGAMVGTRYIGRPASV